MQQFNENINKLTDHLFRNEAKKMVAALTKIFGAENLETAEDVVQDTLIQAINLWKLKGIPNNPVAWLYTSAKNKAIDIIRRKKHLQQFDFTDSEKVLLTSEYTVGAVMDDLWKEDVMKDGLLSMMFACCHPGISTENQVTLILKTLCSFSTAEIAQAFLTTENVISKRLYRTKEFFRQNKIKLEIPTAAEINTRTDAVLNAIYLLFNEGYNSTHADEPIRKELMQEAMMLCRLLTENRHTQMPAVFALMALMCFHSARTDSRLTAEGEIILLSMQDRSKWDAHLIEEGNEYMGKAAFGDAITTYHLQAAIAFEHCTAKSVEQTNWQRILQYYEWLMQVAPSPVVQLNKAVATFQLHGAGEAIKELDSITERKKLESYYLYHSLLGEISKQQGKVDQAKEYFQTAMSLTASEAERKLLKTKIAALFN
ncbi:MAG: RNA polymerase subunit sigma-24 [Chitinophagaceae bacterium]|nr:RNA polymerase subunit sigma-24 [Chitinophagaceae bacterium]